MFKVLQPQQMTKTDVSTGHEGRNVKNIIKTPSQAEVKRFNL